MSEVHEYLTVGEVAELLRLSKSTVYRLCSEGRIPHYKTGKMNLFRKEEVLASMLTKVGGKDGRNNTG